MEINNLPLEIQNKIFLFYAEHPCAKMIKQSYYPCMGKLESPKYFDLNNEAVIDKEKGIYMVKLFMRGRAKYVRIDPFMCSLFYKGKLEGKTDWDSLAYILKRNKGY